MNVAGRRMNVLVVDDSAVVRQTLSAILGQEPDIHVSAAADPIIDQGVPYYVHDYFGPGRHAKIASTKAPNLMNDGSKYRSLPPLTGDESVVAEVSDVAWPKLLDPVDDLPPGTIVLSVKRNGDRIMVRGVSHDNGKIREVTDNDKIAAMTASGSWRWVEVGRFCGGQLVVMSMLLGVDGARVASIGDDPSLPVGTGRRIRADPEPR